MRVENTAYEAQARPARDVVVRAALAQCRTHFIAVGLFSGLLNILYLAPSIYMLQVYDRVVPTRGTPTLFLLTAILAFSLLVFVGLDVVRMRLLQRASVRLERLATPRFMSLALGANGVAVGPRSQAIRDLDTLRGILTGPAIIAVFDLPWAPIYLFVSYLLHPLFGLFALSCGITLIVIAWIGERSTADLVRSVSSRGNEVYRLQDFALQTSEVSNALGMRRAMVANQLAERVDLVTRQGTLARTSGNYLALTKFLRMLFQSAALGLGAWLAIEQRISAGSIFAASLILGRALQPIEQILAALKNVLSASAAYKNLQRISDNLSLGEDRTKLPVPKGHVTAEGITVLAPGGQPILKDVTLWLAPGESLALVGPSGAGKSTLLRVIAGIILPDRGEVRIDGARFSDWDRDTLGKFIGYMPQDPTLFPFTIRQNISRLRSSVEGASENLDARVIEAATVAGAHDMILRLPLAYDTDLSGRDGGLSAGQKQVVALARAVFDWPPIVILDEPNAHLDGDGEARLIQTLAELKARGACVIVSTHRTGLLQAVDKILLLRDGAVQAFGPRDAVLRPTPAAVPPAAPVQPAGPASEGATAR